MNPYVLADRFFTGIVLGYNVSKFGSLFNFARTRQIPPVPLPTVDKKQTAWNNGTKKT